MPLEKPFGRGQFGGCSICILEVLSLRPIRFPTDAV
jgi:hypothetical protein